MVTDGRGIQDQRDDSYDISWRKILGYGAGFATITGSIGIGTYMADEEAREAGENIGEKFSEISQYLEEVPMEALSQADPGTVNYMLETGQSLF